MGLHLQDPRRANWAGGPDDPPLAGWLVLFLVFFLLAFFYGDIALPADAPDHVFHGYYVRDVFLGRLTPDYDTVTPPYSNNNLPHPALYYFLAGKFTRVLHAIRELPLRDLLFAFDLMLGVFTVIVLYRIAAALIPDALVAVCAALAAISVPQFAFSYIGPNSDHLANLMLALTAYLALRYFLTGKASWLAAAACLAVLTPLAKLPQAVPALTIAGCCGLHFLWARRSWRALWDDRRYAVPVIAAGLVTLAYVAAMTLSYGKPYPAPSTVEAWLGSRGVLDGVSEPFFAYLKNYAYTLMSVMPGPYGHHRFIPLGGPWNLVSILVLASMTAPVLLWIARPRDPRRVWFAAAVAAAVAATVLAHFVALYRFHLQTGYDGGIQFRYLQLISAIALIALFEAGRRALPAESAARAVAAALAAFMALNMPLAVARTAQPAARTYQELSPQSFAVGQAEDRLSLSAPFQDLNSGHIQTAAFAGNYLLLRGWVYDPLTGAPARTVIAVADGAVRGAATPMVSRPDVQRRFNPGAETQTLYGFDFRLPRTGVDWSDLRVYALSGDGVLRPVETTVLTNFRASFGESE